MNLVTYHLMRNGQVAWTDFTETERTPQDFADRIAAITNADYADEVHVWFARDNVPDVREPDATARVPR